jgi:ATP-dependent DNA ligase
MNEYPELNEAVAALPAKSFLIDGEAIVTNAEGLDLIHHVQTSIDDSGS